MGTDDVGEQDRGQHAVGLLGVALVPVMNSSTSPAMTSASDRYGTWSTPCSSTNLCAGDVLGQVTTVDDFDRAVVHGCAGSASAPGSRGAHAGCRCPCSWPPARPLRAGSRSCAGSATTTGESAGRPPRSGSARRCRTDRPIRARSAPDTRPPPRGAAPTDSPESRCAGHRSRPGSAPSSAPDRSPRTRAHIAPPSEKPNSAACLEPTVSITARTSSMRTSRLGTSPMRSDSPVPLVEQDQARERRQPLEEASERGLFPRLLQVRDEAGHDQQIKRAGAQDLVGDAQVAAAGVAGVRRHRSVPFGRRGRAPHRTPKAVTGYIAPRSSAGQPDAQSDSNSGCVVIRRTADGDEAPALRSRRGRLHRLQRR